MYEENYADFTDTIHPIDFLKLMFKNTAEDGTIILKNWYITECTDFVTYKDFRCKLSWDRKDLFRIIDVFILHQSRLLEISHFLNELDDIALSSTDPYRCDFSDFLENRMTQNTYATFVAPIKAKHPLDLLSEVIIRVGDDLCGFNLIRHSRRLCQLMSLGAPECVILREGRMLIASLALNCCGREKVQIEDLFENDEIFESDES